MCVCVCVCVCMCVCVFAGKFDRDLFYDVKVDPLDFRIGKW